MGHAMVSGGARANAPSSGILLGDIAEGSVVKLNESGNPVEFYVACHNYESALNGAGRTLLVRKDCCEQRTWNADSNAYASSDIDTWLNGTYKNFLDSSVKSAIGTTNFYYTPANGNSAVATLNRSVFLLSMAELYGTNTGYANVEGSILPTSSILKIAYYNGTAYPQLTRSPAITLPTADNYIYISSAEGGSYAIPCSGKSGPRPCFTLSSMALFAKDTLLFKEMA